MTKKHHTTQRHCCAMARASVLVGSLLTVPAVLADNTSMVLDTVEVAASASSYLITDTQSATGTDTPLRQTPQSVQVVTGDLLRDQATQNMSQALRNVSAAQAGNPLQTPAYDATLIRGFAGEQMLDGMATYYNAGDPNAMYHIERIEVLKGPNALLFGGGAGTPLGGVVNVVSKMPEDDNFTELGFSLGSHDLLAPRFDINRVLSDDGAARFRLTGSYVSSEADVDVVDIERYSLNPTLMLGAEGNTTLTLQGRLSRWESPEYQGLPAVGTVAGDFRLNPDLFIGNPDVTPSYSRSNSLTATLAHTFNETWSNETRLRIGESQFHEYEQLIWGNAPDVEPSSWSLYQSEVLQAQKEVSLSSHFEGKFDTDNATHKLLLGFDASRIKDKGAMLVDFAALGPVDLAGPVNWPDYVSGTGAPMIDGDNRYTTAGVFAQWQSTFNERLHLLGGVRLAHVGIDNHSPAFEKRNKISESKWLPRLGVVYDVNASASLYASYTEGMKGNPFALYSGAPQPETSRQTEVGLKFGDDTTLSGSVSVFQIERSHALVPDPATYGMTSLAEGEQRSRGLELDMVWQATEHWQLSANYALLDAELTRDIPEGALAGSKLPFVPRHAGGIWLNYDLTDATGDGWRLGAGVQAQSSTSVDSANRYKVGGFATADMGASYLKEGFTFNINVKNVFDREYFEAYKYLDGRVSKGAGRSWEISVSKRF